MTKSSQHVTFEILPALQVEVKKALRSKVFWISILAFLFFILIAGLFMFILKKPELADRIGLVGAKAQVFGGVADWPGLFELVLLMSSIASMIVFGFIFIWIFGREYSDKTVYDLLALPTSRITIVSAKLITAAIWSIMLILQVFILTVSIGAVLNLPRWSGAVVLHGLWDLFTIGILMVLLCIPFALVASATRGYLAAVGCIFVVLVLGQVLGVLGYGQYFPWSVPGLYSDLAQQNAAPPVLASYIMVGLVGILSIIAINIWWKYADQT